MPYKPFATQRCERVAVAPVSQPERGLKQIFLRFSFVRFARRSGLTTGARIETLVLLLKRRFADGRSGLTTGARIETSYK